MHLCVSGLPKSIGKLSDFLSLIDNRFSVIGLSETWLNNDTVDLYELPEYKSIHLTRPSRKVGGVSLYVSRSHDYIELSEINICNVSRLSLRHVARKQKLVLSIDHLIQVLLLLHNMSSILYKVLKLKRNNVT